MASSRPRAARRIACVAGLIACLAVRTAYGQPTPADRETARSLMAEGRRLRDARDLRGALEAFRAADAIMGVPTTGYEVAATCVALGQLVEAREILLRVLRAPPAPDEPAPFAEARRRAEALNAHVEQKVPAISIVLEGGGDASRLVTVDGEIVPGAALGHPRKVNPGKHTVVASVGTQQQARDVTVAPGDTATVTFTFPPSPSATAAAAPEAAPVVSLQPHGDGAGPRRPVPAVTWISLGFTAAGVGVGTVTGVLAMSTTRTAREACVENRCPPEVHDDIDRASAYSTASTIAFAAAGAAAGVALVSFLLRPQEPAEAAVIAPSPGGLRVRF